MKNDYYKAYDKRYKQTKKKYILLNLMYEHLMNQQSNFMNF